MTESKGFTLIELVLVIAIIAILASLTVSAYQTYVVRAQVAEGLGFAASAKLPIADAYARNGSPPAGRLEAGLSPSPTDTASAYVSQVDIDHGRIDITFGNQAHADIQGDTLSLTPYVAEQGAITWRCGNAQPPTGKLLSDETSYERGNIDQRYLPPECR